MMWWRSLRSAREWKIRAAKSNGLNLLRLNGGTSIFETEQFYNLCDETEWWSGRKCHSIGRTFRDHNSAGVARTTHPDGDADSPASFDWRLCWRK